MRSERQNTDELVYAHSALQKQLADATAKLASVQKVELQQRAQVQELQRQLVDATEAVHERESQCQALEEHNVTSLRDAQLREEALIKEREAAIADKDDALSTRSSEVLRLNDELQKVKAQLKTTQRLNSDLEMSKMQLTKAHKQLEEDNSGLFMGLEAKQQELELVSLQPPIGVIQIY